MANTDVIQEEVDSAYNTLLKSYLDLRLIPDKSKLEDLINKAKDIDLSKYTEESVNELKTQLTKANEVFVNEEATQEEINEVTKSLDTALNNLVAKGDINLPETPTDSNNGGRLPTTGVETGYLGVFAILSIILGLGFMYRKNYKKIS